MFSVLSTTVAAGIGTIMMALILQLMGALLQSGRSSLVKSEFNSAITEVLNHIRDEKVCTKNFINQVIANEVRPNNNRIVDLADRVLAEQGVGKVRNIKLVDVLPLGASVADSANKIFQHAHLEIELTEDPNSPVKALGIGEKTYKISVGFLTLLDGTIKRCASGSLVSEGCELLGGTPRIGTPTDETDIQPGNPPCQFASLAVTDDLSEGVVPDGNLQVKGDFVVNGELGNGINLITSGAGYYPYVGDDPGPGPGQRICMRKPVGGVVQSCPLFTWQWYDPIYTSGFDSTPKLCGGGALSAEPTIVCEHRYRIGTRIKRLYVNAKNMETTPTPGGDSVTSQIECCPGVAP